MQSKLKTRIRDVLTSVVKTRQWLMDNGYGANDMDRANAIRKIKTLLEHYSDKDARAHIKLVVHLKREIKKIMPGMRSKNKKLRTRAMAMVEWCEARYGMA